MGMRLSTGNRVLYQMQVMGMRLSTGNKSLVSDAGNGYEAQYMRNIEPHNQVMGMRLSTCR